MNLVHQQRPGDHRRAGKDQRQHRRARTGKPRAGSGRPSASPICGQARQIATHSSSPARPTSPTQAETSLGGRDEAERAGVSIMPARLYQQKWKIGEEG
jgi:hypothetical protein